MDEHSSDAFADGYLGEFRRGPAVFTVVQRCETSVYRVDCNDGNGPSKVCEFSEHPSVSPHWHGAWRGDEWCAWIEFQARKIIERA